MELLINELSLKGQFETIQDFIDTAIPPMVSVLNEVDSSQDLLYKKYDFYSSMVTPHTDLHTIITGQISRQVDTIRKVKRQLVSLFEDPYWEDSPKHSSDDSYLYLDSDVSGSSIAEACERDKVTISFLCDDFNFPKLEIKKGEDALLVDNLFSEGHYEGLAKARGYIVEFSLDDTRRFNKTSMIRQGQSVYKELVSGYYWYLDNLHKNHFEVFNSNEVHIGVSDLDGNIDSSKKVNGRRI
jgi:hypothetical protein